MATTQHTTYECSTCGGDRHTSIKGSFCSLSCYHKHKGSKFLNTLKHNHCFCFACGTQLKETVAPDKQWLDDPKRTKTATDSIIGFEYHTEHAEYGIKGKQVDSYNELIMSGIVCGNCGTCNHQDDFLRELHHKDFFSNLVRYTKLTRAQGQHNYTLNPRELVKALRDTHDFETAIGRCICD